MLNSLKKIKSTKNLGKFHTSTRKKFMRYKKNYKYFNKFGKKNRQRKNN